MDSEDKNRSKTDNIENNSVKDNTEPADEKFADKLTEDLAVNLPGKGLPLIVRIIAFFTLIGGLSIIGSLFADIVRPHGEDIYIYALRTIVGVVAVVIAYGLIEHERWAIWLYGLVTLLSLFTNPFLAFIPGVVVVYLYTQRSYFSPSLPDFILEKGVNKIKSYIVRNKETEDTTQE